MKVNLIYACKKKLIGIDSMLPLLMELKERYSFINVLVFFRDEKNYSSIKKNYHIWKALGDIKAQAYVSVYKSRLKTCLAWLGIIGKMLLKKNIILKQSDTIPRHAQFIKFIKKVSSTIEIDASYITDSSVEYHKLIQFYNNATNPDIIKTIKMDNAHLTYDYVISQLDRDLLKKYYFVDVEESRFCKAGYLKRLAQWSAYVEREAEMLPYANEKYFVYFLSGISGSTAFCQKDFLESLAVLKKYTPHIKTIFKPAFITNMDVFIALLNQSGYSNYLIDYAHPSIVSCKAVFAMSYAWTSALFNAYVINKPVLVYTRMEDPKELEVLDYRTFGGQACDYAIFGDPERLDKILHQLVHEAVATKRDPLFMIDNFQEVPQAFWRFWENMLAD